MTHYPHWHPYRDPRDLGALIPPDRRLVKAAILATVCFLGGATLLAAAEVAMTASVDPSGQLVRRDRDLELTTSSVVTPPAFFVPMRLPAGDATMLAREAILRGDPATAKALLLPRVAAGRGSADDVRIVHVSCQALHDQPCLEFLKNR